MTQLSESDEAIRDILSFMSRVSYRENGEVLTTYEQLNSLECNFMLDLARLETLVNGHIPGAQLTIDDLHRFSGKVFRHWDTRFDTSDNQNPIFDESLPAEHSVKVGTVTNPSVRLVYAYLTISVATQPHRLNLSWNDYMGRDIAHEDINFDYSMEKCLNLAIFQYDQFVAHRVKQYNERLIIATARRRLVNFCWGHTNPEPCTCDWDKDVTLKPLVFAAISPDQRENLIRKTVERLRGP